MNAFFIGIGGMGMSGLAKILHASGYQVAGSDRNLDGDYCKLLRQMGINIYPQDGSGPEAFMKEHGLSSNDFRIVKSTAVEDNVPDVISARRLEVCQIMRSDLLAELFNEKKGIAIGGTAGKTTTTGLVTWILEFCGKKPSCAVGGIISGLETNALHGEGENFVIEADESDGSIVKYRPWISVVTNISRDHKPLEELQSLFTSFLKNTDPRGMCLICADDDAAAGLQSVSAGNAKTYSIRNEADYYARNILIDADSASFTVDNTEFSINMPGEHNVSNALAAIAVACECGLTLEEVAGALKAFPGMKRRFEKVGTAEGVTVIDDFAHNPVEIMAAIKTARKASNRRFIVYQPHGYGPTSFTRDDLIKVFSGLQTDEFLFLDEIFYGGGTVNKDVSSQEIIDHVSKKFPNASFPGSRQKIVSAIVSQAKSGDMVLVMGARDINVICREILQGISQKSLTESA